MYGLFAAICASLTDPEGRLPRTHKHCIIIPIILPKQYTVEEFSSLIGKWTFKTLTRIEGVHVKIKIFATDCTAVAKRKIKKPHRHQKIKCN